MSDHETTPAGWYPNPDPAQPGTQRYHDGTAWTDHTAPAGTAAATAPPAKKGGAAKIVIPFVACLGLAAVLLIVAVVASSGGDDDEPLATSSTEVTVPTVSTPDDQATTSTEDQEEDGPSESTERATTAPSGPDGSADRPLTIGTGTQVGDYEATVTAVNLDATAAVKGQNDFNEDPSNGRYIMVSVSLTYVGAEEGEPSFDLSTTLQGGNGVQYEDYDCGATLTNGRYNAPTLTNGGSASFDVCMDVPAEAIDGATLFLEDALSFDDADRIYWATT